MVNLSINRTVKLSEILLSFGRAISITLNMGLFHSLNMAKIACLIGQILELDYNQLKHLVISALLHDIGISSVKKAVMPISPKQNIDIFSKSTLDIIELLNYSREHKITEITGLIVSHSLEGAELLKQTSIRSKIYNILNKNSNYNTSIDETSYLSKILCLSDILECATSIEETLEEKTISASAQIQEFSSQFFDEVTSKKSMNLQTKNLSGIELLMNIYSIKFLMISRTKNIAYYPLNYSNFLSFLLIL